MSVVVGAAGVVVGVVAFVIRVVILVFNFVVFRFWVRALWVFRCFHGCFRFKTIFYFFVNLIQLLL